MSRRDHIVICRTCVYTIMSVSESSVGNRCILHCSSVSEVLKPFTEKRWNTFLNSVKVWKDLVGYQADIARDFVQGLDVAEDEDITTLGLAVPERGGYHQTCYRYFTDLSKQACREFTEKNMET